MFGKIALALTFAIPAQAFADIGARDISGISLGMNIDEAKSILVDRFEDGRMFDRGPLVTTERRIKITFRADKNDVWEIYALPTESAPITRITREQEFINSMGRRLSDPIDLQSTTEALTEKYGEPTISNVEPMQWRLEHTMEFADIAEGSSEISRFYHSHYERLFSGGPLTNERIEPINAYLNIKLIEREGEEGFVAKMEIDLIDIESQYNHIMAVADQARRDREAEQRERKEAATTPDI